MNSYEIRPTSKTYFSLKGAKANRLAPIFFRYVWFVLCQFLLVGQASILVPSRHQDLGNLPLGTNFIATIKWYNSTTDPMEVRRIRSDNESVDILDHSKLVKPKDEGSVQVRIHASSVGKLEVSVTVEIANEPSPKIFTLSALVIDGKQRPLPDQRFFITPREFIDRGVDAAVLVDVRSPEKYQAIRIPGSLNVPLYQVKTKTYLKSKDVVLLNEGHEDERLIAESNRLRQNGFTSVKILKGGIRFWLQQKRPVTAEGLTSTVAAMLSPQSFDTARFEEGWIIMRLSTNGNNEKENFLPVRKTVRLEAGKQAFQAALLSELKDHSGVNRILLASETGEGYDSMQDWLEAPNLPPVFFLSGGMENYERYRKLQAASSQRRLVTQNGRLANELNRARAPSGGSAGCGCGNK